MIEPLIEHIANLTTRVYFADTGTHGFVVSWDREMLNIIWGNYEDHIISIDSLPPDEVLVKEELISLENILRSHLTTNV